MHSIFRLCLFILCQFGFVVLLYPVLAHFFLFIYVYIYLFIYLSCILETSFFHTHWTTVFFFSLPENEFLLALIAISCLNTAIAHKNNKQKLLVVAILFLPVGIDNSVEMEKKKHRESR